MAETFEKWAERMEIEYKEFKKKRNESFKDWFDEVKQNSKPIKEDYAYFVEFWEEWRNTESKDNKVIPKNYEVYFMSLKVAQSFYSDCVEDDLPMIKRGSIFASGKSYAQVIKDYFEKGLNIQKKSKKLYWVEICSALQKRYSLFNNLWDINVFLTGVCSDNSDSELRDYGLYVRNIDDLCIAFGILNGKPFDEIKTIIMECRDVINSEQEERNNRTNAAQTITQQLENDFNNLIGMNKDIFVQKIKNNVQKFLPKDSDSHWTTLKKILNLFHELNYIKFSVAQGELKSKDFNLRLREIYEYFCDLVRFEDVLENVICTRQLSNNLLTGYIGDCLNLDTSFSLSIDKYEASNKADEFDTLFEDQEQETYERSLSKLRRMCIVALMKDFCENEFISGDRAEFKALEGINDKLEELHLRPIDYSDKDRKIINKTTDIFDWFIIECIKRDKSCAERDDCISGWYPFCDYMGINEKG